MITRNRRSLSNTKQSNQHPRKHIQKSQKKKEQNLLSLKAEKIALLLRQAAPNTAAAVKY